MKEQFVTFDIAKKLKELGFDEPCMATLTIHSNPVIVLTPVRNSKLESMIPSLLCVPLWQQAIDWLRENHNIHIVLNPVPSFVICKLLSKYGKRDNTLGNVTGDAYSSFYHAKEQAVLKAIELIK